MAHIKGHTGTGFHQYEIEPSFFGRVMSQSAPAFNQYLQQTGVGGSTLDVNKAIEQGMLKAYRMPTPESFNAAARWSDPNTNISASSSQGFYSPAPTASDTARIFLNPIHHAGTLGHEGFHQLMSHEQLDERAPLSLLDKLDKSVFKGALPSWLGGGKYKTEKQYDKEFGMDRGVYAYSDITEGDQHPQFSQYHYDKYIEEPSLAGMPPSLRDSLSMASSGQIPYPMKIDRVDKQPSNFLEYLFSN